MLPVTRILRWCADHPGLIVFAAALAVRLCAFAALRPDLSPWRHEMEKVATAVAHGRGLTDPYYCGPTGPTAHFTPVYPALLGGVYALFGDGVGGDRAKLLMNELFAAIGYALLPWAARGLGLGQGVGLGAGLLGALFPLYIRSEFRGWEVCLNAALLIAATTRSFQAYESPAVSWRRAVADGLLWGVALLTAPNGGAVLAACIAFGLLTAARQRRALGYSAAVVCMVGLALAPWAARNAVVLGRPIFLRSNLALELQVSNHSFSEVDGMANRDCYPLYHPNESYAECAKVAFLGEARYMDGKWQEFLAYAAAEPGRLALQTGERALRFWVIAPTNLLQAVASWGLTALAAAGLVAVWRSAPRAGLLITLIWCLYPLVYYFVAVENRYRFPIHWTLLLMAAAGISTLVGHCVARFGRLGWATAMGKLGQPGAVPKARK